MKKIIILLISFYQKFISITLKNLLGINSFCRFSPTCSEYSKESIQKYGLLKGAYLSLARFIKCHPFTHLSSRESSASQNDRGDLKSYFMRLLRFTRNDKENLSY
ncbi:MAG: membrane protein insertion efficiency factor YidD [Patescibacteria group bacterium]|nr:membrane protein insertion efficiency factor YidD [Patescibacteria group bacterium]